MSHFSLHKVLWEVQSTVHVCLPHTMVQMGHIYNCILVYYQWVFFTSTVNCLPVRITDFTY